MNYDPLQPDAYTEHLGEVNRSNNVVLAEDIRNSKGVLIAKKGERVSPETVAKIIQFKLLKPIEESVDIENSLTAAKLLADMREQLAEFKQSNFHEQYEIDAEVERGMKLLSRFPILSQKITVLALRMPQEYTKAVLVAWLALLLGKKLDFTAIERDCLLIAALGHDIGMLHIDRNITEKTSPLTPDEWRTLQGHVAIGYTIFKKIDGMLPNISRAVLEHHEVPDGTGYLSGKRGDEMSSMGRLIGVVDAMCAVLLKMRSSGRSPRDLIPILRINGYVYDRTVCGTFIQLLTEHKWPDAALLDDQNLSQYADSILQDRDRFNDYARRTEEILKAVPADTPERQSIKAARVVHDHLTRIIHSSGVLDAGYVPWLQSVVRDKQHRYYREVEDTRLMLDEVRWQFVKLTRLLWAIEQDKNALNASQHHTILEMLNNLPKLNSGN